MIRRRVVVHGTVQGVFFRDTCRQQATRRGVSGWVTNRDDGSVEAVFEGDEDDVAALVEWCRVGPPRAEVAELDTSDEQPAGASGFEVR